MKEFKWKPATEAPKTEPGKWSKPVVVITNFEDVFLLAYFRSEGEEGGCWQRPHRFNPGEKVEWWIEKP